METKKWTERGRSTGVMPRYNNKQIEYSGEVVGGGTEGLRELGELSNRRIGMRRENKTREG